MPDKIKMTFDNKESPAKKQKIENSAPDLNNLPKNIVRTMWNVSPTLPPGKDWRDYVIKKDCGACD